MLRKKPQDEEDPQSMREFQKDKLRIKATQGITQRRGDLIPNL